MRLYWSLDDINLDNAWVTIGSFDGVHIGHQSIITNLTAGASHARIPAVVLTFHPHPAVVVRDRRGPFYLTSPEERAELLFNLGVDIVIIHPFDKHVSIRSAKEFVTNLKNQLGFTHLCVGHDFALGRDREGDIPTLRMIGEQLDYSVSVVDPIRQADRLISSRVIRAELSQGEVGAASQLLGRHYWLEGRVIHGDGRGHSIGFPTANMQIWSERLIPRKGVYACTVDFDGESYSAVTNIGVRPTFVQHGEDSWVETHLLNFSGKLYDRTIRLNFIQRLRDERRFSGVEALVEQINQDILNTKEILKEQI